MSIKQYCKVDSFTGRKVEFSGLALGTGSADYDPGDPLSSSITIRFFQLVKPNSTADVSYVTTTAKCDRSSTAQTGRFSLESLAVVGPASYEMLREHYRSQDETTCRAFEDAVETLNERRKAHFYL